MPGKGETSEGCCNSREEACVIPVHDYEHLEDALGTVLQNGVDRLNGLDLLQFVADLMVRQIFHASQ